MKRCRVQAKDLDDANFLRNVYALSYAESIFVHFPHWVFWCWLETLYPAVPLAVIVAKGKRLKARGLLDGCMCGDCRGDLELTSKGCAFIGVSTATDRSSLETPTP